MELALGVVLDRLVGDPQRWHPVAGMGQVAARLEGAMYRDSRWAGTVFTATLVGAAAAAGLGIDRCPTPLRVSLGAGAMWAALGGTTLRQVAAQVAVAARHDDLAAARALMPSLCGRDPAQLDMAGCVRAALESVAENTSDAAVGPLVWGAVAGPAGVVAYRMTNTLDAMVGYRNERYRNFGWASARLDDAANLLPARVAALAVLVAGPRRAAARAAWHADARAHPSPNAGVVEAAFAGALGVRLGGPTVYRHGVEERPTLGRGAAPTVTDLEAAIALSARVQTLTAVAAVGCAATVAAVRRLLRRHRP